MKPEQPDPQLGSDGLTVEEVGALWAFLHGDIMVGGIRQLIREHWGLCSRHAWGHAVVEIELWESGAGARGGHQPFDVGVLYSDLLGAMRHALSNHARAPERALKRRGECYVCAQLRQTGDAAVISVGYAGFRSEPLTEEANRFSYTRVWLTETIALWAPRRCPACPGGHNGTGQLCRAHLLECGFGPSGDAETVVALTDINQRLHRLVDSMTEQGAASTPEDDASWIEALGWFHGWSFPNALSTT
jgi:hypothetical protein